MPNIFISHAWEDNDISRQLARKLRQAGANVHIYYSAIEIANDLPGFTRDAIDSCDLIVVIWSRDAASSRSVNLEWQQALNQQKNIVPCVIDNAALPGNLRGFYYVELDDFEQGYQSLVHLLNFYINEPRFHYISPQEKQAVILSSSSPQCFRQMPQRLTEKEVTEMIQRHQFFDIKRNKKVPGVQRKLDVHEVNDTQVVIDHASGLTWQRVGSKNIMWFDRVNEWIEELNKIGYADFQDWRLPTLEEAMSLMINNGRNNGVFIDPVFDSTQKSIWTSDLSQNGTRSWVVFYNLGSCFENCFDFNNFVRAVRSGEV